ncbi:MFS transporter [Aeromicrobium sp.]|uniref:MFS transporter n=1 Tax=Aeromicrobium sp. TaxID=1871063 RepID=UPI0019A180DC|nr:MFS transporter [Aeromicrobium sp.]MBC7631867.1 MFS transporter [Aeromicrobium sp.]
MTVLAKYKAALSRPGAALFSVTATISRMPLSMAGLGIVLLVSERTGSYAEAGLLAAVYVLAAAAFGPIQGRLADHLGQSAVLWVVGAAYAVGIFLTLLAIESQWSAPWPQLCAAAAGLASPQTGSMVRARWTHAVSDRSQLNTAFSIEAVLDEVVFVVGPVLVTFLTLQVADLAGLIVAAVAATLGCWALALQHSTAPPAVVHDAGRRPPIGWTLLGPVVAASLGLGVVFGSTEVIVVAFTAEEGRRGAAGAILAIWAVGSLVSGVIIGALPHPRDPSRRLRVALLALSLLFAPLGLLPGVWWLAAGMFLAGSMISPTLIAIVSLIEMRVPASRLTEALTWSTTGLAVGVAPGAAVAGWVVDERGASAGFLVPLVAGLAASAVVWSFGSQD